MNSTTTLDNNTIDATTTVIVESSTTLKRRVSATGEKHGKAVSQVGVVTLAYGSGFAKGFMSSFKD